MTMSTWGSAIKHIAHKAAALVERSRDLADGLSLGIDAEVEDLREFRATEESTGLAPLVFGVETGLWSTVAKTAGTWYRGIL
ncbi:MAG: hypothetical protein ABJL67_22810 [Sulfitobacter sp.]